jgi:hypothetical protein
LYCSIGVRSEENRREINKIRIQNVYNLYGGIFEYKNERGKINNQNKVTDSAHLKMGEYQTKGIKFMRIRYESTLMKM